MGFNSTKSVFDSLLDKTVVVSHAERLASTKGWRKTNRILKKKKRQKELKKLRKKRPKLVQYKEYIKSVAWRNKRFAYYNKYKKECVLCKTSRQIGLHHIDYTRLGNELDQDLIALCWGCHERYHRQHGTKKDMKEDTFNFIIEGQEELEFAEIIKNL